VLPAASNTAAPTTAAPVIAICFRVRCRAATAAGSSQDRQEAAGAAPGQNAMTNAASTSNPNRRRTADPSTRPVADPPNHSSGSDARGG
jgi:hypothetical protein